MNKKTEKELIAKNSELKNRLTEKEQDYEEQGQISKEYDVIINCLFDKQMRYKNALTEIKEIIDNTTGGGK